MKLALVKVEKQCLKMVVSFGIGGLCGEAISKRMNSSNTPDIVKIGLFGAACTCSWLAAMGTGRIIDKEFESIELGAVREDSIRDLKKTK